ncbi:MAG: HAD family phosphatase, partial [Kiritimatiellae bacterium]|nr:HAD family phosphatase [Kiritimatiellia bacterium]
TADDVAASKPDPASYHLAQRRLLALHPALRAFLAVEDTPDGIQSDRAASLPVLALATHSPPSALLAAGASAVSPSLASALR